MDIPPFSVTWDYRCPFARNAHEHVAVAMEAGAPWQVTFVPFSLSQAHVAEDEPPVWDDPDKAGDLLALAAGIVGRDRHPDRFLAQHQALFAARHDHGQDQRDPLVVSEVARSVGLDGDRLMTEVRAGWAQKEMRAAHERAVSEHGVFGVPTFVVGEQAVFVRFMHRPAGDADLARTTIERTIRLIVDHPELNEFKHSRIHR
jgi:protein-disulfide isomerase-like protein with CxxC motif